jgi:hypothetical protein
MESLIELVAASFARHGIECPAGDSQPVWGRAPSQACVGTAAPGCSAERSSAAVSELAAALSPEPPLTTTLPEHNYRKSSQGDPAP